MLHLFDSEAAERRYVADLVERLRRGTRKPEYTLDRLRLLWSPRLHSSFPTPPIYDHPAAEDDIPALVSWLSHDSSRVQQLAVLTLAAARGVESMTTPLLQNALADEAPLVRIAAIERLRQRPDADAARARELLRDSSWRVRWHAAELLLRQGVSEGLAELLGRVAPRRWAIEWFDAVALVTEPNERLDRAVRERRARPSDPWIQSFGEQIDAWLATRDGHEGSDDPTTT